MAQHFILAKYLNNQFLYVHENANEIMMIFGSDGVMNLKMFESEQLEFIQKQELKGKSPTDIKKILRNSNHKLHLTAIQYLKFVIKQAQKRAWRPDHEIWRLIAFFEREDLLDKVGTSYNPHVRSESEESFHSCQEVEVDININIISDNLKNLSINIQKN